jgi:hypothetical protein
VARPDTDCERINVFHIRKSLCTVLIALLGNTSVQQVAALRLLERKQMLFVVLALSALTHLINAAGFPDIFYDEGVYMRRAMHLAETGNPQENPTFYDHPYFGQMLLAGTLSIIGYPDSLAPTADTESISALYLAPRVIMGLLAVADTFLVYKITEARYGRKVAFVASLLFAVMPATWLLRRILLDGILLPFLLSSILLAIYSQKAQGGKKVALVALAGAALGLAMFTKLPAFMFIPLVAYLCYTPKDKKLLALMLAPAILIPLAWPAYSVSTGHFQYWQDSVLWQTQRQSGGFANILLSLIFVDPVLLVTGLAGTALAAVLRDKFILLWTVPFLVFLAGFGYVQYFYWIAILPAFCISTSVLFQKAFARPRDYAAALVTITGFGLACTIAVVTIDMTSAQYQAAAFLATHVSTDTTVAANPTYSWILTYVYDNKNGFTDYRDLIFIDVKTEKLLLAADSHFMSNKDSDPKLAEAYESTHEVATFENPRENPGVYPFTSLILNGEGSRVEIRSN